VGWWVRAAPAASEMNVIGCSGGKLAATGRGKLLACSMRHLPQMDNSCLSDGGILIVLVLVFPHCCKNFVWWNLNPLRKTHI
jgi:hypothetical protein